MFLPSNSVLHVCYYKTVLLFQNIHFAVQIAKLHRKIFHNLKQPIVRFRFNLFYFFLTDNNRLIPSVPSWIFFRSSL